VTRVSDACIGTTADVKDDGVGASTRRRRHGDGARMVERNESDAFDGRRRGGARALMMHQRSRR